ncbi:Tfp pilus assembly protein FimT/FimU [Terribacillus saccharophilus]|uniref:pilus assembly FimT family protein n=1 Tax=Terribacillus saccharophilus TaxID=361277 RepID=UPI003982A34C
MKLSIQREKGFTLIEILVSLTILAIVIITFVPIFTQAAIHNKINGNMLKTNEAAHVVASEYENLSDIQGPFTQLPICSKSSHSPSIHLGNKTIGDSNYDTRVELCKFETGGVKNLVQAVFITQAPGNPEQEGEARKFLLEVNTNAQN